MPPCNPALLYFVSALRFDYPLSIAIIRSVLMSISYRPHSSILVFLLPKHQNVLFKVRQRGFEPCLSDSNGCTVRFQFSFIGSCLIDLVGLPEVNYFSVWSLNHTPTSILKNV